MLILETPRLILRDLTPDDLDPLHLLRSDPVVTRYCDYIACDALEQTRRWLCETMAHNAKEPRDSYNLAVVRRADRCVMGWIGIGRANDPTVGELDFGYALRPAFWGQGYMTEALSAVLRFATEQLGTERIYGKCDAKNVGSARVMQKAGLRLLKRTSEDDGSESLLYATGAQTWAERAAGR
jgi:[ribosomal protein S5]-alanine N-acetyltransferase